MPNKTEHLTKLENDIEEVGIQIRSGNPSIPKNSRIHVDINSGELRGHFNDTDFAMSVNVLKNDPVAPLDNQVWLNTATSEFKWKFAGVVDSVSFSGARKIPAAKTSSEYSIILTSAELKEVANLASKYPNMIVDAFNQPSKSVMVDVAQNNSKLQVSGTAITGTHSTERETSGGFNSAEGIVMIKSQGFAPKAYTVGVGSEVSFLFEGDLNKILKVGKKLFCYREEKSDTEIKGFFSLGGDLNPVQMVVLSITYDAILKETTVNIETNSGDYLRGTTDLISLRKEVRFMPVPLNLELGSAGLLGNLTSFIIKEAALINDGSDVMGQNNFEQLVNGLDGTNTNSLSNYNDSKAAAVNYRVSHSPNKQNWLIQVMYTGSSINDALIKAPHVVNYFSTDGLITLNRSEKIMYPFANSKSGDTNTNWRNHLVGVQATWLKDRDVKIHDDGRCLIVLGGLSDSGYYSPAAFLGKMNGLDFDFKEFSSTHGNYVGYVGLWTNAHVHLNEVIMDWENSHCYIKGNHSNLDPYYFFFRVDWETFQVYTKGYSSGGTDYQYTQASGIYIKKFFEGEDMILDIMTHGGNQYNYGYKTQIANIIAQPDGSVTSLTTAANGRLPLYTNSLIDGVRGETVAHAHHRAGASYIMDYGWDEVNDRLVMLVSDDSSLQTWIDVIDFGRTRGGKFNDTSFAFSNVPITGSFTVDVFNVITGLTETTSPIAYTATNAQIKTILASVSFYVEADLEVVGTIATGINVIIKQKKGYTFTINTNSMSDGTTATVINITANVEGEQPIWLRFQNSRHENEVFNPADGMSFLLSNAFHMLQSYMGAAYNSDNFHMGKGIGNIMTVTGTEIFIMGMFVETTNLYDTLEPHIIKIPDYEKTYKTVQYENYTVGAAGSFQLSHSRVNTNEGRRLAQIFTTPALPFGGSLNPDGKVPVRTLQAYMYNSWLGNPVKRYSHLNIVVKIVGVGLGSVPDMSVVYGVSNKYNTNNMSANGQYRWHNFTFDNLKLDPSTEYCYVMELAEPEFYDFSPASKDEYSGVYLVHYTQANSNTGMASTQNEDGSWTNRVTKSLHFRLLDHYIFPVVANFSDYFSIPERLMFKQYYDKSYKGFREATIKQTTPNKYVGTYRLGGYVRNNWTDTLPSNAGSQHSLFDVDNTIGIENAPVISNERVFGIDKDKIDQWDRNLQFCINFGVNSKYTVTRNNSVTDMGTVFRYTDNIDDVQHNRCTDFGGYWLNEQTTEMWRDMKYSKRAYGMQDDADFASGRCWNINGSNKFLVMAANWTTQPYQKDFVIEFEYKTGGSDNDGSHQIFFSIEDTFYMGQLEGKFQFYAVSENNIGLETRAQNIIPYGEYRRWRVTRTYNEGLKVFYNTSKTGGTWVQEVMQPEETSVSTAGIGFGKGWLIGDNDSAQTYIHLGGYWANSNYTLGGKMGYFKYAVGSSTFAYEGINEDQRSFINFRNIDGNILLAEKVFHEENNGYENNLGDVVLIRDNAESSSLVRTPSVMLTHNQLVEGGQKPAVKITLEKESLEDPSAVEGIVTNFTRK